MIKFILANKKKLKMKLDKAKSIFGNRLYLNSQTFKSQKYTNLNHF